MSNESFKEKYRQLNETYKKKSREGYDLSEVKVLVGDAVRDYKSGNHMEADMKLYMASGALASAGKRTSTSNVSDPNDFSKEFAPIWRWYVKYQIILVLIGVSAFVIINFVDGGMNLFYPIVIILLVSTSLWIIQSYFKVRCPKCGKPLTSTFYRGYFYWTKHCPWCGAILKKRGFDFPIHPWIPWQEKTNLEKTLIIVAIIILSGMFIACFIKGVKITHN